MVYIYIFSRYHTRKKYKFYEVRQWLENVVVNKMTTLETFDLNTGLLLNRTFDI